jgi:hypothetical protein
LIVETVEVESDNEMRLLAGTDIVRYRLLIIRLRGFHDRRGILPACSLKRTGIIA